MLCFIVNVCIIRASYKFSNLSKVKSRHSNEIYGGIHLATSGYFGAFKVAE